MSKRPDEAIYEVGHDADGGAIWQGARSGERWNAGDDHECGISENKEEEEE